MEDLAKQWVINNNIITSKQKELKLLKNDNNDLSEKLLVYMKNNQIEFIQIPESNRKLLLKEKVTFSSINKDYLLETLTSCYEKDVSYKNAESFADKTVTEVMSNRSQNHKQFLKLSKK